MRIRFKKLEPEITLDEYFEAGITLQRLLNFFRTWRNPPRPDSKKNIPEYMSYLKIMSAVFDKEEQLIEADELLKYHSGRARIFLRSTQEAASQAIKGHIEEKSKVSGLGVKDFNERRYDCSLELRVGFFAEKAAKRQEINEWVRTEFDDLYRGVYFIKPALASTR